MFNDLFWQFTIIIDKKWKIGLQYDDLTLFIWAIIKFKSCIEIDIKKNNNKKKIKKKRLHNHYFLPAPYFDLWMENKIVLVHSYTTHYKNAI